MKKILIFPALLLFTISCSENKTENKESVEAVETAAAPVMQSGDTTHYTYTVYSLPPTDKSSDEGFGFEIKSASGQGLHIKQDNIPAVAGTHPFISEENAAAVAQLMIYKLNHGIVPPAISIEELDSLQVVY